MKLSQRRFFGDRAVAVLILLALTAFLIVERLQAAQADARPPYALDSDSATGLSAWGSWLQTLGFELHGSGGLTQFAVPDGVDVAFVVEPSELVLAEDIDVLRQWVEGGGVLVLAASRPQNWPLFEAFEVTPQRMVGRSDGETPLVLGVPLMVHPLIDEPQGPFNQPAELIPAVPEIVPQLFDGEALWLATHAVGDGEVVMLSRPQLLTNAGLRQVEARQVALNVVGVLEPGATIWFDQWHHGLRAGGVLDGQLSGPADWLRFTPTGRALLFGLVALFLFLVLSGQRLGRAEPLPEAMQRRQAVEYVHALADLTRRTGRVDELQHHYYQRLRRQLGRRFHLDPTLDDRAFAEAAAAQSSDIDPIALAQLLTRLQSTQMGEKELIEAVAEINDELPMTNY